MTTVFTRIASIAICLIVGCGVGPARGEQFAAARPVPRVEYPQQRLIDITAYLREAPDLSAVKLLFVGDSITDFFCMAANPWIPGKVGGRAVWDETFGPGHARNLGLNLGISGDRTEWLLYRLMPRAAGGLGELDRADLQPEFVILMAGINNTYAAETPLVDSVFAGILALVDAVHAARPKAVVILESLLPSNEEWRNREAVLPVNSRLAALVRTAPYSGYVSYLDLYPHFVDAKGQQLGGLFMDNLHPNEAGYRVWRDALVPALEGIRATR